MQELDSKELKWFATRMVRDSAYALKYLECQKLETSRIRDISTLLFIHCTERQIESCRANLYDRLLFYKDATRQKVEAVPDSVMKTFLVLAPFHDEPVQYIPVDDPHFFEGPHKRVTSGPFKGAEGIIKRIKGDRRLVIRLSDRAAVITPFIHPAFLEDVE